MQVSGPAAGLVVIVWQVIEKVGIEGFGAAVIAAGVLQVIAGLLGGGQIFRAVSPTVIYGMLSGIGVLIFGSQFHVMTDASPHSDGIANLFHIPYSLLHSLDLTSGASHPYAASIGILTIVLILVWERFRPSSLQVLPGALVGIVGASAVALSFGFEIRFIELPGNLLASLRPISGSAAVQLLSGEGILIIATLAIVASAETLLCATAVDKLHTGVRTNYNRELVAQGVGNMLCGLFAALPMTGVIVRSSANVQAGAKTRASAILHGVWLLVFITLFPSLLNLIPTASLAALLVFIGYKLMNFGILKELRAKGNEEVLIFLLTVISIVGFDLLTGIMIGVAATLFQLIYRLTHLEIEIERCEEKGEYNMELSGAATFLRIPALAAGLEKVPANATLHVHLHNLSYVDHACLELLTSWGDQHEKSGGKVFLEWDALHHYAQSAKLRPRHDTVVSPELIEKRETQLEARVRPNQSI